LHRNYSNLQNRPIRLTIITTSTTAIVRTISSAAASCQFCTSATWGIIEVIDMPSPFQPAWQLLRGLKNQLLLPQKARLNYMAVGHESQGRLQLTSAFIVTVPPAKKTSTPPMGIIPGRHFSVICNGHITKMWEHSQLEHGHRPDRRSLQGER
jgi:hypothetical protein